MTLYDRDSRSETISVNGTLIAASLTQTLDAHCLLVLLTSDAPQPSLDIMLWSGLELAMKCTVSLPADTGLH